MRKRITSLLLSLALCLSLLPPAALATGSNDTATQADAHSNHPICGDSSCTDSSHSVESWTAVSSVDDLKKLTGAGYLTTDIQLPADTTWEPANGVTLCLNGHSITGANAKNTIYLRVGVTFTLTDCNGSGAGNGKITHASGTTGSGVYVNVSSIFNMYGGEISGNTATNGGGVYIYNGTFKMFGGSIQNNTALGSDACGGGVYIVSRSMGDIGDTSEFEISGTASISGNSANSYGGGVYTLSNDNVITKVTMKGGVITGNSAVKGAGGVYVYIGNPNTSNFTVSGNVQIKDNWKNGTKNETSGLYERGSGTANNVYLYKGLSGTTDTRITIDNLTNGAEIGVTTQSDPTDDSPIDITHNASENDLKYFFSDISNYSTAYTDGKIVLQNTPSHRHPVCGAECTYTESDAHADVTWTGVSNLTNDMPAGNYYLTQDVTLTSTWEPADNVKLCLNGHNITGTNGDTVIEVKYNNITFTLTDCKGEGTEYGKITHANGQSGSGVQVDSDSTFNMYGGNITRNSAITNGGGVQMGGTFNMYGGSITNNSASNNSSSTGDGGGMWMSGAGTFNMYGGSITGNSAAKSGGGVYAEGTSTNPRLFNMYGGSITGNNAGSEGGGVYLNAFNMTVSGNVNITSNTVNTTTTSNVYLPKAYPIAIGAGGLTSGAKIGVTAQDAPTNDNPVTIATNAKDSDRDYFTCDTGSYYVVYDNSKIQLSTTPQSDQCEASVTVDGNTTNYLTVAAAIDAVENCTEADNATVTLLKDRIVLNDTLEINSGTFTLDLSDSMLNFQGTNSTVSTVKISGNANVTLKGTAGKFSDSALWSVGICNFGSATCAVEVAGGKLTIAEDQKDFQISTGQKAIDNMGVRLYNSDNKTPIACALLVSGGEVEINGGFFACGKTGIKVDSGKLTFNNGQIGDYERDTNNWNISWNGSYSRTAISVGYNCKVTINGGDFTATLNALYASDNHSVTLNGGSFSSIYLSSGNGSVSDLLGNGYGYKENTAAGTWKSWADCASSSISNVKVVSGATLDNVTVSKDLTEDLTVGYTNGPTLTATATQPGSGASTPTYQWYEITNDDPSGKLINGATNNFYAFPTGKPEGSYQYFCVAASGDYSRRSNVVTVTVKAKTQATVTIGGLPTSVAYGDTIELTASQSGDTSTGGTWGWNFDNTYFKLVESNTNTGTLKLQAIQAYSGTNPITVATATYTSSTHVGSASVTVSSIGKKVLSANDLEFVGLTGNSITKVYDGTTQHTSDISLSVREKVNNTGLNITVSNDKITYNSQNVNEATSATLSLDGINLGPNYQFATDFTSITVQASITKATPTVTGTGTATGTYRDKLSALTIRDLNADVAGTWSWKNPNEVLDSVTSSGSTVICETIFTPTDTTNYDTVEHNVYVTVNPKPGGSLYTVTLTQKFSDTTKHSYELNWAGLPDNENWAYNGVATKSNTNITITDFTQTADGGKTMTYTISGGQADDTVTFTLTATCESGHYTPFTITVTVNLIDREEQTGFAFATDTKTTATYGDTDFTVSTINAKTTVSYDSSDKTVATVDKDTGKVHILKAGTTTITAKAAQTNDYKEATATYTLTVNKKDVTITGLSVEGKTYNGNTTATVSGTPEINGKVGNDDVRVDSTNASATFVDKNVGNDKTVTFSGYTLGGTAAGNYNLTAQPASVTANITPKTVSVTGVAATERDYAPGDKEVTLTRGTVSGVENGDTVIVDLSHAKGTLDTEDAGNNKSVTVSGVALSGTDAGNYTLSAQPTGVTVTIRQIDPSTPTGLTGFKGQKLSSVTLPQGWTWADPDTVLNTVGDQAFTANYAGSINYNAKTNVSVTVQVSDKADANVTITGLPSSVTYGDADFTLTASAANAGTGTGNWTWSSSDDTVLAVTGSGSAATVKVLKSGSATITAQYESDTTKGRATTAAVSVAKKAITVAAKDQSIYVNETAPDLSAPAKDTHYTVAGLVESDPLTVTMKYQQNGNDATPDVSKTGTYDIVISATVDTEKYTLTTTDGKLTISTRPSSGGGGSSRPSYAVTVPENVDNGSVSVSPKNARQGETVTVTVTPDEGYVLDKLVVTDKDGKESKLTDQGGGKFTFPMPGSKAEVKVSFKKDSSAQDDFVDVKPGDYFYDAVQWAKQKGITTGTDASHFSPNGPCTRAQIVTFLWRNSGSPVVNFAMDLKDVAPDAYYAEAVRWALSKGITNGTSEDTFSPDAICTREQAVAFLYRMAGSPAVSGGSAFTDVAADAYYASAVTWAEQKGITNGIGDGRFGTGSQCTRAQIVTFLYRASK